MVQIATGEKPFYERRSDSAVIFRIVKGERPILPTLLTAKPSVEKMMTDCWDADPAKRPTAADVNQLLEVEFCAPAERGWGQA